MAESKLRVDVDTERRTGLDIEEADGGRFKVLIHNDNVTPYDFVITVLLRIFRLSPELAEHITWQAHTRGVAPVCTRPRGEAERLITEAHTAARTNGYPLTFSMEPK
jgi:ATP-dependent Clp protease adaptor protein ClpS